MDWSKNKQMDWRYDLQQRTIDEIALRLGVVAYRPEYHGKDRDKNTVLFYLKEDSDHNLKVDREQFHYTRSEAHDLMKYRKVEISDRYIWRDPFWWFENSDANGLLDYGFANHGKLNLRTDRWKDVLEGHVRLALAKKIQFRYIACSGGYLEPREADTTNNDLNRKEIAAIKQIYGVAYMVDVNYFGEKRERILAGEESIFEEVTDAPVHNFAGSFCVPRKDQELERLILAWNGDNKLPKKGADVDKMYDRVTAIGGISLIWY